MKKALVLGDYEKYIYHPFKGVDEQLKALLEVEGELELICTDDYDELLKLEEYDLFVSYTDRWKDALTDEQVGSIISFVAKGGSMLVLHSGIALQTRDEFVQLVGGKFVHHPKMDTMTVRMINSDEELTQGVGEFEVVDEPYQFDYPTYSNIIPITEYEFHGEVYPSSWKKTYCKGKIVYLMNGHTAEIFKNVEYGKLIKNSVKWLLK